MYTMSHQGILYVVFGIYVFFPFLTAQIQTWPLEEIVWMIWNMLEQALREFDLIVFFLFLKDGEQRSSIIDRDTRGQKKSKGAGLQYDCRHIFRLNIHWLIDWSFFDKWPMCHRLSMHWVIKLSFFKTWKNFTLILLVIVLVTGDQPAACLLFYCARLYLPINHRGRISRASYRMESIQWILSTQLHFLGEVLLKFLQHVAS